jgi:hypothetical protein
MIGCELGSSGVFTFRSAGDDSSKDAAIMLIAETKEIQRTN